MNGSHGCHLNYLLVRIAAMATVERMTNNDELGGRFTFPDTSLTVHRMGYGAIQLAGPQVWGPPRAPEAAVAVLREAIALGIDHVDTSDAYGPHVTYRIPERAALGYRIPRASGFRISDTREHPHRLNRPLRRRPRARRPLRPQRPAHRRSAP